MTRLALLLLLSIAAPARAEAPITFTARWQGSSVAVIRWSQPASVALTCLSRESASGHVWPIHCWRDLPAGLTAFTLGDTGPLDYTAHPQIGDHYLLELSDVTERAELLALVWMPMVRGHFGNFFPTR
jgi:hypothetical protein